MHYIKIKYYSLKYILLFFVSNKDAKTLWRRVIWNLGFSQVKHRKDRLIMFLIYEGYRSEISEMNDIHVGGGGVWKIKQMKKII